MAPKKLKPRIEHIRVGTERVAYCGVPLGLTADVSAFFGVDNALRALQMHRAEFERTGGYVSSDAGDQLVYPCKRCPQIIIDKLSGFLTLPDPPAPEPSDEAAPEDIEPTITRFGPEGIKRG